MKTTSVASIRIGAILEKKKGCSRVPPEFGGHQMYALEKLLDEAGFDFDPTAHITYRQGMRRISIEYSLDRRKDVRYPYGLSEPVVIIKRRSRTNKRKGKGREIRSFISVALLGNYRVYWKRGGVEESVRAKLQELLVDIWEYNGNET